MAAVSVFRCLVKWSERASPLLKFLRFPAVLTCEAGSTKIPFFREAMQMDTGENRPTVLDHLRRQGVSRRDFLNWCAYTASLLALPPSASHAIAEALATKPRPSVIWLSIQECTGCSESILRSFEPTLESLIFDQFSLDYHHVLQAAAGAAAEQARHRAIQQNFGKYALVVDGGIPLDAEGHYSTTGGKSGREIVRTAARGAALDGDALAEVDGIPPLKERNIPVAGFKQCFGCIFDVQHINFSNLRRRSLSLRATLRIHVAVSPTPG